VNTFWSDYRRDVVTVIGPDARSFLHSQLSQDVNAMAVGEARWSFLLEPTGRISVLARVWRRGDEEFVLDTDEGFGDALVARLERFKIRVHAAVDQIDWRCLAVRGGRVDDGLPSWGDGCDLLGPDVVPPAGIDEGTEEELEAVRVRSAWPKMGREITETSIPAETGVIADTVSFTKGCYPGQELVERMDSRASQAPRHVTRILATDGMRAGDELVVDGQVVATVTSVAAPYALALVKRSSILPPGVAG
jgi:folate-binding protein YgfZ